MVAKRSSRAVALLLAMPSAAFALGLGDVHLLSPLNAPLDAQIELVDVGPDEANSVQAQLASRDTFARYGLDWPSYLGGVQVRTERTADGHQIIHLKSTEAITEPFVTLLVEVNWSHGHLVREYTMLLDPPVYAPSQSALASAPVAAPQTGAATREGSIERAQSAPAPAAEGTSTANPAAAQSAAPAAAQTTPASSAPEAAATHVVRRGETLSKIASATAGAGTSSARTRSWMVAIYQANPRAFERNMNVLRTGAVLRMPDAAAAATVSPADANAEIRRQYTAWRGSAGEAAAGAQPGRLHLVTPSQPASAGTTAGGQNPEVSQLQGRVQDLEGQLAEQKRLLEMKNADLARLQSQLAARQGAPTPPAAQAPAATQPPSAAAAPPAAQTPAATAPPAAVEQKAPAEAAPTEQPTPRPAPAPVASKPTLAKATKTAPQPKGGGLSDFLGGYWWLLALLGLAVAAFFLLRFVRSQRSAEFDDGLGRLAVAGGAAAAGAAAARGFSAVETPAPRAAATDHADESFLVEETGSHARPRVLPESVTAPVPVRTADDTLSSETAINLDQGDPLAEADFHMAYGLYDQAADLIRIAISREPTRRDLKLKLLEVFFVWGNKEQFLTTARELADSRGQSAPGEWEKILIMGKQLAPEDPLFSGTGAVSGAAAGGVDLDLEGGQSRVDFDLLGEPAAAPATQNVDLDIGAAVGHDAAATGGATDRNTALDAAFLEGSSTGTTRQMTQPARAGGLAEVEGPTVEQPALGEGGTPTIRQKVESALRQGGTDQTAELAIDDLGLDLGPADTVDQPVLTPVPTEGPTLVAGLDEHTRALMEDTNQRTAAHEKHGKTSTTGAWQFDPQELDTAATQAGPGPKDASQTSRLRALGSQDVDVDLGDASSTHPAAGHLDLDVGASTGTHASNGGALDLDVGTATVPESSFAATQRLSTEDLALPDLEPVTMSEVGTKLDLARAYMDMGDPDGARNILEEVLNEGSAAQKQEAQRLMESLPG